MFEWALGLTFAIGAFTTLIAACKDTIRGFERTDIPAITHVGQQLLTVVLVVPVLVLGGGMRATLAAQIPVGIVVLVLILANVASRRRRQADGESECAEDSFHGCTPFVWFGLAMALQPNIDAVFLSKLAPAEVMGWFAVSRRLIGVLLFPATALIGALYPTLCRLFASDSTEFARVARGAFQGVTLLAVPVALGCGLYPELGVTIFNRGSFGAAETQPSDPRRLPVLSLLQHAARHDHHGGGQAPSMEHRAGLVHLGEPGTRSAPRALVSATLWQRRAGSVRCRGG